MAEITGAEIAIDTRVDPSGAYVVGLTGELDASNVATLAATVASIADASPPRLIFDLRGLRFMDSAGIAVLINASTHVPSVLLRDPSPVIRRVIEATGLTGVLPVEP